MAADRTPPYFVTGLQVEKLRGHDWRLLAPLVFASRRHRGSFVVPAGTVIDFASTPRALWWLVPKTGQYDFATALHDASYRGQLRTPNGERVYLIRLYCDQLLDEACAATGVPGWVRTLLYRGVRLGGASSFYRGTR